MTIRPVRLSRTDSAGEVAHLDFGTHVSEIVGPRNSGKTTILRIIDYLLGEGDSAANSIGSDVASRYVSLSMDVKLAGSLHRIERRPGEYGAAGKIFVNSEALARDDFSTWVLDALGWPAVQIPKARHAHLASSTVALSFRTLLRHIYRREDSWSEFAYKEDEFHRRAVLRYFMGILDVEGELGEFEAARAEQDLAALEARLEESTQAATTALQSVAAKLGIDLATWSDADATIRLLDESIERCEIERASITDEIGSLEGYNAELTLSYETGSATISLTLETEADLRATIASYQQSLAVVRGDIARLERADRSIDAFAGVPVQHCPACGQDVRDEVTNPGHCFLCSQPVTEDSRKRRVALEVRALKDEEGELLEQIERTQGELQQTGDRLRDAQLSRDEIANQITDQRSALLAPYVVRLEQLSGEVASMRQSVAALEGLRVVSRGAETLGQRIEIARRRHAQLVAANLDRLEIVSLAEDRCARFSGWMNGFLGNLTVEPWRFGTVELRPSDMAFTVGGQPWRERLGGETKVSFFLAYHDALLRLSSLDDRAVRAPGLAVLDNPIQQGVPDRAVAEALRALEETAAEVGGCCITTLGRTLPTGVSGAEVFRLNHVFNVQER